MHPDILFERSAGIRLLQQVNLEGGGIKTADFRFVNGEGWALHFRLIIVQRDQKLRRGLCDFRQMAGIFLPHFRWQSDKGGPVIDRVDSAQKLCVEIKYIANENVDTGGAILYQGADRRDMGCQLEAFKKLPDGTFIQFGPGDGIAF